ncbi:MAG TPA: tetratricopeptide repeat protein [Gemmatimonadaceae bacterium]
MDYDRLRELQQKFEENPRRYFAPLANEYRKGGQPKRAIEICRAHLAQMPGHMSGQIVYGQSLYEAGEFDEAKQVFGRALSLDPENLIALRSLGDMELQAGNTVEARTWYTRLLDADPKDSAVIALVSEIDAAADATPVGTTEIPGVDTDAGDQQIPVALETLSELVFLSDAASPSAEPEPSSETSSPADSSAESQAAPMNSSADSAPSEASSAAPASATDDVPVGLERHYPVQEASPPEPTSPESSAAPSSSAQSSSQEAPVTEASVHGSSTEGPGVEDVGVTVGDSAADGLKSIIPEAVNPLDWSGPPPSESMEEPAPAAPEPAPFTTAFSSAPSEQAAPPSVPESRAAEPRPPEPRAPEPIARAAEPPSRAPEPAPRAPEPPPRSEEKTFSGASSEPFVNETMAQLYLQQGYKQLALQVYRQLAVSRPRDEGLRNRIAEIEAADAAAHPGEVHVARKEPAVEKRSAPEEAVGRQPSIREFFATLGRRRPPAPSSRGRSSSGSSGNNQPAAVDMRPPLGATPPGGNLDSVFAGATVSPADARAASRLAGAFSGTSGSSRTSPPTPPVPTPRVNPRVPQTQESEEDVAKFRAWLDGLTGE